MKTRLDVYLTENALAESRERAKSLIMSGCVYINNQKADKAGIKVGDEDKVEVRGTALKYVSRGGIKLEKALDVFGIELEGLTCVDVGASTGGFTDCMLQRGAKKVYAIDVGYGQLAWKIRQDERVVPVERTNIRYVTPEQVGEPLDFASIDVSFISLKLVLPVVHSLLKDNGCVVCLVKPQFEAGREKVGKKGVVRDKNVHIEVVEGIVDFAQSINFEIRGIDFSPVRGPEGNIEYLVYMGKTDKSRKIDFSDKIAEIVEKSHTEAL